MVWKVWKMTYFNRQNIILSLFAFFIIFAVISNKAFAVAPNWADTKNSVGPKVYIDTNNQYYFGWGQLYSIKYEENGKTLYSQIELKGVRGTKAAVLSVSDRYKDIYVIPSERDFIKLVPANPIYNSSRMALSNTNKEVCPNNVCKFAKYYNYVDLEPYIKNVEYQIKKNWRPKTFAVSKNTVVLFKISKEGRLSDLKILESSGNKEADDAAIKAIQGVKFEPLPAEYKKDSVDIKFTFDYNAK